MVIVSIGLFVHTRRHVQSMFTSIDNIPSNVLWRITGIHSNRNTRNILPRSKEVFLVKFQKCGHELVQEKVRQSEQDQSNAHSTPLSIWHQFPNHILPYYQRISCKFPSIFEARDTRLRCSILYTFRLAGWRIHLGLRDHSIYHQGTGLPEEPSRALEALKKKSKH